jgi:integrase
MVKLPNGKRKRVFGMPEVNSRQAAVEAERDHIERERLACLRATTKEQEVPTFKEWFKGRFWNEWVIGRKNKPSEVESKDGIYDFHLEPYFGSKRLDEIDDSLIAQFRAKLVKDELSEKRINNILAVLSKSLRYATRVRLIEYAPEMGLFKIERPDIESWSFEEYARLLEAAKKDCDPEWHAAMCLAGEAGLRLGEVRGLKWQEDVDLVAGTLTVQRQRRHNQEGTPKGRTKRVVPMTPALVAALKRLSNVRIGYVIRNLDGTPKSDQSPRSAIERISKRAGLTIKGWHHLRHTFGTHAAMFGVNPWSLMTWMGHKTITETMRYVHVANAHRRPIPPLVIASAGAEVDPDRRIILMLGARSVIPRANVPKQDAIGAA